MTRAEREKKALDLQKETVSGKELNLTELHKKIDSMERKGRELYQKDHRSKLPTASGALSHHSSFNLDEALE